jgi:hypothetical protein
VQQGGLQLVPRALRMPLQHQRDVQLVECDTCNR